MKNFLAIIFIALLAGTLYTLTLRGAVGNPTPTSIKQGWDGNAKPFELSPERGRFAHVMSLAETGKYALTGQLEQFVHPDVGYYNGNYFSFFAPGISYLALPFYEIGQRYNLAQVATFAIIPLASILALIFIFLIARNIFKMPVWGSVLAALIFAFSSTAWSYATTLYQHHVTVLCILAGFYAVWKYAQGAKYSWAWGFVPWLAYGVGIFVDYPNALLVLPVIVYFFVAALKVRKSDEKISVRLRTSFITTAVVFVLLAGLHAWHNQYYLGSWHRLSGSLVNITTIEKLGLQNKPVAEVNEAIQAAQDKKANVAHFFSDEQIPHSPFVLLFSFERGLFIFSPIFLLGLFAMFGLKGKWSLEHKVLISLVLTNLFLYSSWGDPWGGWAYGPRYLIPSMSILALYSAYYVSKPGRFAWFRRLSAFVLICYSSAIALLGAITTNAVPPKIEAVPLHTGYNFLRNWEFLLAGSSNNFFYNTYLESTTSLLQYGVALYDVLIFIFFVLLFIVPLFSKHEHAD